MHFQRAAFGCSTKPDKKFRFQVLITILYSLAVAKFAADVISPRVRDMDERSAIDPAVISGIFENGLMGIEVPEEYGGE